MKVSHRLYLTVTPAIIGVLLLAGLAYWGKYERTAPELVIVLGAIAVLTSLALAWSNARDMARRIERLAGAASSTGGPALPSNEIDEISEIEFAVGRLSSAVELAESSRLSREQLYERRMRDYALLLASIADASIQRLEEVRLPLHILLENHFGDLNENQEEMLGAARTAAEGVDADMLSLRQISAMDLGERPMRHDRIKPADIIEAIRALLRSTADAAGVALEFDIAPLLPAIQGDRVRLQEAFVLLLSDAVGGAMRDSAVKISVEGHDGTIRFLVHGTGTVPPTVRWAAAVRVVQAHDGTVERTVGGLSIELPTHTTS